MNEQEQIESLITYIDEHITEKISTKTLASLTGLSISRFNVVFHSYFSMSPGEYIRAWKLRRAARDLQEGQGIKDVATRYGYNTLQSFSRAFQKEFEQSPKTFMAVQQPIPDMPLKKEINGSPIELQFLKINSLAMPEYKRVIPEKGNATDLMEEVAGFTKYEELEEFVQDRKDQVAIWWFDISGVLSYQMGYVKPLEDYEEERERHDTDCLEIPSDYYAVFSMEKKENRKEIAEDMKCLTRYVFNQWTKENRPKLNRLAYTFERYRGDKAYLYLPLVEEERSFQKEEDTQGMDRWIRYIDKHICEKLEVRQVAQQFHYSERHFRQVFGFYFGMTFTEYIQKRRLYLAVRDIREKEDSMEDCIKTYRYRSIKQFQEEFSEEFHMTPEQYERLDYRMTTFEEYYEIHKQSCRIRYKDIEEMTVLAKPISEDNIEEENLPALTAFWMLHDFSCIKESQFTDLKRSSAKKISFWSRDEDENRIDYYLGPVADHVRYIPQELTPYIMKAGRYAVFSTEKETDADDLTHAIAMLSLCAFHGWIHEYRYRVDFSRTTFLYYEEKKLYAYVPISQ